MTQPTLLHAVLSAKYIEPSPSTAMEILIDATIEGERDEFIFIYRPDDPFGDMNPQITAWFFENPDFEPDPYVEPPAPVPVDPNTIDLPRREFRRALLHAGMTTTNVVAIIDQIEDETQREEMMIWWEDTPIFQRFHPHLVAMTAAAGLNEGQANAIWSHGVDLLNGT